MVERDQVKLAASVPMRNENAGGPVSALFSRSLFFRLAICLAISINIIRFTHMTRMLVGLPCETSRRVSRCPQTSHNVKDVWALDFPRPCRRRRGFGCPPHANCARKAGKAANHKPRPLPLLCVGDVSGKTERVQVGIVHDDS